MSTFAGVFADFPAVAQRGGSSGVGRAAREPDGAGHPAGSHGYYTGPGLMKRPFTITYSALLCLLPLQLSVCAVLQCYNRDTRLLAGTAVAMLINTAPESRAAEAAAWSLLQVSSTGGLLCRTRTEGSSNLRKREALTMSVWVFHFTPTVLKHVCRLIGDSTFPLGVSLTVNGVCVQTGDLLYVCRL